MDAGKRATATNTAPIAVATDALRDGVGARRQAGEIAGCLPARQRNMDAGCTRMRDVLTTTTRTSMGRASSAVPSLSYAGGLPSFAEVQQKENVPALWAG